jgi:hypothetical protein
LENIEQALLGRATVTPLLDLAGVRREKDLRENREGGKDTGGKDDGEKTGHQEGREDEVNFGNLTLGVLLESTKQILKQGLPLLSMVVSLSV